MKNTVVPLKTEKGANVMKKQTVEERYMQQQIMKSPSKQSGKVQNEGIGTQQLQETFKQIEQALLQAHQSVRQAQGENPSQIRLQQADQRLKLAIQQLQQLKAAPNPVFGLPKGTQQQFTQLGHQIQQAGQTLQLIKSSISN